MLMLLMSPLHVHIFEINKTLSHSVDMKIHILLGSLYNCLNLNAHYVNYNWRSLTKETCSEIEHEFLVPDFFRYLQTFQNISCHIHNLIQLLEVKEFNVSDWVQYKDFLSGQILHILSVHCPLTNSEEEVCGDFCWR